MAVESMPKLRDQSERPCSCCRIHSLPHCICGTLRLAPLRSTFASSDTILADMASLMCRRDHTRWNELGRDALAILDSLRINKVSWCGLSMGGMVGQWLGANAPERIERLVLSNTSSYFADKADRDNRLKLVREKGIAAFAKANMERWFTQGFRERSPQTVAWMQEMFAATPLEGYVACAQAVRDMDHRDLLSKIKAPTLVIGGKQDPATPLEANEYIKSRIPGARLTVLDAAHLSNVEQPQAYTNAVLDFLLAR